MLNQIRHKTRRGSFSQFKVKHAMLIKTGEHNICTFIISFVFAHLTLTFFLPPIIIKLLLLISFLNTTNLCLAHILYLFQTLLKRRRLLKQVPSFVSPFRSTCNRFPVPQFRTFFVPVWFDEDRYQDIHRKLQFLLYKNCIVLYCSLYY